jgi:hypothetical protein
MRATRCDGAGWHQPGGALVIPDNIVLLHLPPYSPELNPMENVWAYLRQNKLCALVWDTYDEIVEACKTAWNWLIADPARITSIGLREWASISLYAGRYNTLKKLGVSALMMMSTIFTP